jgi:hypothetical protein
LPDVEPAGKYIAVAMHNSHTHGKVNIDYVVDALGRLRAELAARRHLQRR